MRPAAALTLFSAVLSLTAFAAAPIVTTTTPTGITTASAQLNGTINPGGESTTGWFRMDTTSPGTCNDTFGTRVPTTGGTGVGSGSAATPFNILATGLLPGTTYYVCAIASNASGTAFGAVVSFSTPAQAPATTSTAATFVTSNSATLNGSAIPRGASSEGFFRYSATNPGACSNSFGTRVPATGGTALGNGNTSVNFTENITGLQAGVTYYYCAIATNAQGTGLGNLLSFTALVTAPTVATSSASGIGGTQANLNGVVNPNGAATTGWFRISASDPGACNDAFGTRVPSSGGTSIGSGSSNVAYQQVASSLTPGTTYYFCAIGQNSVGTSLGTVQTFSTPNTPTVTLTAETNLTSTTVTLNGTAHPNGSATSAYFRISASNPGVCTDTFGTRWPSTGGTSISAGAGVTNFAQNVTSGLLPGTTYYVCAIATNGVGTAFGSLGTITTPAALPTATTSSASLVTGVSARLNGSGNPRGAATLGWYRYSTSNPGTCNDSFGFRVPMMTGTGSNLGSGNSTLAYSEDIASLTPGTTYFFCAITQNAVGTSFGSVVQFTTANVPTVTTTAASSISGTSAQLNGTVNPNLGATTAWFRYATTSPGTCNDSFGTRLPTSGGTNMGSGGSPVSHIDYPSLTPGTTYYFCLIAQNSVGTGFGAVLSFTSLAAPTVSTLAPSPVDPTAATLLANVHPNGSSTTAWFRYYTADPGSCSDVGGVRAPSSSGTIVGAASGTTLVSRPTSALLPGTTYWSCAIASNTVGFSYGSPVAFTTPPTAPLVSTGSVTSLTGSSATIGGSVNPRGDAAVGFFRYSTTNPGTCTDAFGTRVPTSGGTSVGSGNSYQAVSEPLSGLTPGTTYYFCAGGTNGVGTTYGVVNQFTTPNIPTVTTTAATFIEGDTAQLNGTVNPNGAQTTAWYRFGTSHPGTCNDAFGTRLPVSGGSSVGSGSSPTSHIDYPTLTPGTTYYFCLIASNIVGVGYGAVLSFSTPAAPTVTADAATLVTANSATLNATVNPGGAATQIYFRYAATSPGTCNTTFGTALTATNVGAGTANVAVQRAIASLLPGVTYYYCAIASNIVGATLSGLQTFTTPPLPPTATTSSAVSITSTGASLRGVVNPNGAATNVWFRYATTNPGTCNDTFGFRAPFTGSTALVASNSNTTVTEPVTGLSLVTTYYYCAIAQNAQGTTFGAVQSFTTLAEVPTVVTQAATAITTTSATMNAQANPNGSSATGWFRYSTTNPVTCNDTFGTRLPATGGTALGAGLTSVSYSVTPMSLTVGATYYYCAIVQNGVGTGFGAVLTFKTTSTAPTLNTLAATAVGGSTAQLNGSVNPNGEATTGWFRYSTTNPGTCNDTFGARAPSTGGTNVGNGVTAAGFSENLTGLTPGATYYFCALAQNATGTTLGLVLNFTTPQSPTVTTNAATPVTANTATLNGTAVPNGTAATGWFRYSTTSPGSCNDTFGTRAPSASGTSLGSGGAAQPFSQALSGLLPGTQYFFCAISSNSVGTGFGDLLSFTTPAAAPSVVAGAVTDLLATTATFNATGNANGAATTGWFRYATSSPGACNDSFGTRVPATGGSNLGSGTSALPFSQAATGLTSGTTYYVCPIVQNAVGTAYGAVQTFITPGVPVVTTLTATAVSSTTATFRGTGNPNRAQATGFFRFGTMAPGTCNDMYGTRWPATGGADLGSGTSALTFTEPVTGLSQATTYYYCAGATNAVGTTFGTVQTFTTTSAPTVVTVAPSSVTNTTATFNSTINANGLTASVWYRFSTVDPGSCTDTFGARRPTSGFAGTVTGSTVTPNAYSITGLTGGTQYWVCALASNSAGTGFGQLLTFVTPGAPIVTTEPATLVATTTATLNGSALPNQNATTAWFRYSTVNPGSCTATFGTATTTTSLGAGTASVPFSQALTGLTSGATYYYCAIAQNSSSTRYGALLTFSTAAAPLVTTGSTTPIGDTTATLNGSANPRGSPATGWFRYATTSPGTCNDTFGTRFPATGGSDLGSGASSVAFSQAITGLTPNTVYYVCAIASNANGTATGVVSTFTTRDAPTVTTTSASSVLASTATLNGNADPNGAAATGWFRYSTTNPGTCDDSFGTRAPTTSGSSLGSGISAVSFSQALSGLTASTTYYYCAIASNAHGTRFGSVLTFTTGNGPLVTTTAATAVTGSTATLNGNANPNGITSTGWFRYATTNPGTCNDTFGTRAPTTSGTALGAGNSPVDYTRAISGLLAGTTYYYCALASNSVGTSVGAVMSFTTQGPPVVTTQAATAVTASSAMLAGLGNPAGVATTGYFRYATTNGTCSATFGTRAPASGGISLGSTFTEQPFTLTAGGLSPATTYYFCAVAENAQGTRYGSVLSFTTAAGPAVTTLAATAVTSSTATLNGNANPRNLASTGWFRYSSINPVTCNDAFGTRVPATGGTALGSGGAIVPYTENLTGLTPGTTYYFCAVASNSAGTSTGTVQTFVTPGPPSITTAAATNVTGTSATLNGSGVANLSATTGWFRYAATDPGTCNDTFGTRAPTSSGSSLGSGTTSTAYAQIVTGLTAGTTYYFCAIGSNANGTRFGTVMSFTTPAAPVVTTTAATLVTSSSATLNGTANPRLGATTAWFRYASTSPGTCNDTFGTRSPATGGVSVGSGSTASPFSQPLTGLTPGATYYYCAIASNLVGTSVGTVQSFTASAVAPTVTTEPAIQISGTGATLRGSANPGGSPTTGYFRYATTNPGTCNDTFGTRAPSAAGSNLGSGNTAASFSEVLTTLTPGATYYFCAIASNAAGVRFGSVETFVTPNAPLVTTTAASAITGTTATLNGTANPRLGAATGWFRYATTNPGTCDDSFGTRAPTANGSSLGSAAAPVAFSQAITGLTPATTYYFCAIASNAVGTGVGTVQQFRTPGAPIVMTSSGTVGGTATMPMVVLAGGANPNGAAATGFFRIGTTQPAACDDTFGVRAPPVGGANLGSGESSVAFTQAVGGLELGATYWFCAMAENAVGRGEGEVLSFTVAAPVPEVTTEAATDVGSRAATLHAQVNPNGTEATAWFRYDTVAPTTCDDSFGQRVPAMGGVSAGAGFANQAIELAITGLRPGSEYFVCAMASNTGGAAFGQIISFRTGTEMPTVRGAPPQIAEGGMELSAYADTKALVGKGLFVVYDSPPLVCNPGLGRVYPGAGVDLAAKDGEEPFKFLVTDLKPGQHYMCATVTTAGGTANSEIVPFTVPEISTGCGCTTGSGMGLWSMLLVLGALRRRRR